MTGSLRGGRLTQVSPPSPDSSSGRRRLLVVMRHGKAEPFAAEDHLRRLTERGAREAHGAGQWLADQGLVPTHALVSSAVARPGHLGEPRRARPAPGSSRSSTTPSTPPARTTRWTSCAPVPDGRRGGAVRRPQPDRGLAGPPARRRRPRPRGVPRDERRLPASAMAVLEVHVALGRARRRDRPAGRLLPRPRVTPA